MLIKIPPGAPPDIQQALREIDDLLSRVFGGHNIDLNGRRIINAGDTVDAQDYATRTDVVKMIRNSGGQINSDGSAIGTTPAIASKPVSPATQLANDLARVSLRA